MKRSNRVLGALMTCGILAAGCGTGGAAETVRPKDPTANEALGENAGACHDVAGKPGEPLIVDWKPEYRGDLEVAMKQGIAVLAYDCKGIRILPDCHVEGSYAFIGTTRNEQVVQLTNSDEVRANLPLSGLKLGAEVGRGSTIDIAMIMVGKKATTLMGPSKEELKGSCEGATHYVRRATVGAFAMSTGTEGKVAAAADMFGAGVSGSSQSSKKIGNKQGDVNDCKKANPDDTSPPAQCGAPIRLYVEPVLAAQPKRVASAEAQKEPPAQASEGDLCPTGLVYAGGKCTLPASTPNHVCKSKDLSDCTAQCEKGNMQSCGELGIMYGDGDGVGKDTKKGAALMKKGCDGGSLRSCAYLSLAYVLAIGVKRDVKLGVELAEKACNGGDARGCYELGRFFYVQDMRDLKRDLNKASRLFQRSCDGGYGGGCSYLAQMYWTGDGVAKDRAKAGQLFRRACDGGNGYGCSRTGEAYETGRGVKKDDARAMSFYIRGCNLGNMDSCADLGRNLYAKSPSNAKIALDQACSDQYQHAGAQLMSCAALKIAFGDTRFKMQSEPALDEWKNDCDDGDAHACTSFGIVHAAAGMGPIAKTTLKKGCSGGDKFGCEMLKKAP